MKEKLHRFISGQLSLAILFIILGLCLIFMPANTLNVLCKVIFGIALILSGAYHIYLHISDKKESTVFNLFSGVITMIIGIFLFFNLQIVVRLLPWMLGAFVAVDCIWIFKAAGRLKKKQDQMYEGLYIFCAIFLILGILLIVDPFSKIRTMLTFAGWLLLIKGISDIIVHRMVEKALKRPTPTPRKVTDAETSGGGGGGYSVMPMSQAGKTPAMHMLTAEDREEPDPVHPAPDVIQMGSADMPEDEVFPEADEHFGDVQEPDFEPQAPDLSFEPDPTVDMADGEPQE